MPSIDPHLAAGISAGVVTSLLLHPLDVVKVRFQVQDGRTVATRYTGVLQATRQIFHTEGLRGLYRGVVPACWGSGASWGFYFYFYEAAKRRMKADGWPAHFMSRENNTTTLSMSQHMYAAWEAGTITCCFTNPLWLVKTRLQLQSGSPEMHDKQRYRGMTGMFMPTLREALRHCRSCHTYVSYVT